MLWVTVLITASHFHPSLIYSRKSAIRVEFLARLHYKCSCIIWLFAVVNSVLLWVTVLITASHFYPSLIFSKKSGILLGASCTLLQSSSLSEWSSLQDSTLSVDQLLNLAALYNFLQQLILYCCELQCVSLPFTCTLVSYFEKSLTPLGAYSTLL